MDNSYCCVPQCNSLGSHRPRTSFHRFPRIKDESSKRRREQWIRILRIGKKVSDRMVVCGKHFQPSDFLLPGNGPLARTKLKENVIPSLKLPMSSYENRDKLNKKKEDSSMRVRRKEKRERCKRWLVNTRREDIMKLNSMSLYTSYQQCAKHFEDGMFMDPMKTKLMPKAVPTIFSTSCTRTALPAAYCFPDPQKVLKQNSIPSLKLPVSRKESDNSAVLKVTLGKIESDKCSDSKARLSMENKNVKKQLETIPNGKNVPLASDSSGSKFIAIRPSEEQNKVADTLSISGDIEVKCNLYIPTVLKTSTSKPHSNQTKQNHSNLTERDTLSDFKENTDSDITTDTDDDVVNNLENESELLEESSKCQLDKLKTQYKELQKQLKKYQKQYKLLTKDNDNLRKENASHMKDNFSLMKENDCLKEVINSLKQIISVSDEKYFETIS